MTSLIELRVDGAPRGKDRPRLNRKTGNVYTPQATVLAEGRIKGAYLAAGRPEQLEGAVVLEVELAFKRPDTHYTSCGELSAAGRRSPWPCKKPDADNALKLVADALNRLAYRDDADIAHAWVCKRWTQPGEIEHTIIRVRPMPAPLPPTTGKEA